MTAAAQAPGARSGKPAPTSSIASPVALPADAQRQLAAYLDLLVKWNRTYNLTAIRERADMVTHHLNDALAILPHLPGAKALRVLDVGTGAGVPGIPLAIARPGWRVVLLDSNQKKVAFLTQATIELGLANVTTVAARVENYAPDALFDVIVSRAYSDLASFLRGAQHLLAPGGILAAMKGAYPRDEIALLPAGVTIVAAPALDVPGLAARRHLIVMRATASQAPANAAVSATTSAPAHTPTEPRR
ncbi:MAG TPA: 16S rRNA (guanine(527)-N(7))-methyltransferase RsmG [Casimicrobiaceae bacterium]|nr:16S rRNA (guanine(527)-N(7))-methyltransferase RsmG [Casimicrobiaceae bacterium]